MPQQRYMKYRMWTDNRDDWEDEMIDRHRYGNMSKSVTLLQGRKWVPD